MDFIRVYRAADRDRLRAVVEELRGAGIVVALFPAERAGDWWDIEVVDDQVECARAIVAAVLHALTA
jgi:hypothetical protein